MNGLAQRHQCSRQACKLLAVGGEMRTDACLQAPLSLPTRMQRENEPRVAS
jgi:hypothetical protein